MMNEGLDALATLASTSPSAPTWSDSGPHSNNYSSQGTNEIPFSAHGSNGNTSVSTSRGSAAAAPVGSYPVFSASNLMQMLQNGRLSKLQQALQQCGNETNNPSAISNNNLALLMGMQQRQPQPQADQLALLQLQLSYYNSNTNRQSGNQMNAGTGDRAVQHPNTTSFEPHQELALSQALQAHQRAQQNDGSQQSGTRTTQHQVLPSIASEAPVKDFNPSVSAGSNTMPPPKSAPAASYYKCSTADVPSPDIPSKIFPQRSMDMAGLRENESSFEHLTRGQKVLKRAANRKSAQLSRKRKKQCIDELYEENNDLRRKDQILRAIPDLIVVFDSAGKLWFLSESVSMFLGMTADELEGTSFWDCLCEDSVRLLKTAFMDSLAVREPDSDTVPLGAGVWELRLVDKDGSHKIVTLNGVVHFAGDRPECVCSIRPVGYKVAEAKASSNATETVEEPKVNTVRNIVKKQQSVVSCGSSDSSTRKHRRQVLACGKGREIVRNSSSSDSESGSSDDMIPSP